MTGRPPLRRSRSDRVIGGVCGGLGRYLGVDPVLLRVVVAVLAVFGGAGFVLYAIGWLFIPEEGRDESAAQQLLGHNDVVLWVVGIVGGIAVLSALGNLFWWRGTPFGLVALVLVGAVAVAVFLTRRSDEGAAGRRQPAGPAPGPLSDVTSTAASGPVPYGPYPAPTSPLPPVGSAVGPAAPTAPFAPAPPAAPPRRREPSVLGPLTVGAALVVAGVLVSLGLVGALDVTLVMVLAAALAVVGLGLLVGALLGRSRGLIVLGVVLALATVTAAAVPRVPVGAGVGNRTWTVSSASTAAHGYRLGAGSALLDLSAVTFDGTRSAAFSAEVGAGRLTVLVPRDTAVTVTADTGVGPITVGPSGVHDDGFASHVSTSFAPAAPRGSIALTLRVGAGEILVTTDPLEVPQS